MSYYLEKPVQKCAPACKISEDYDYFEDFVSGVIKTDIKCNKNHGSLQYFMKKNQKLLYLKKKLKYSESDSDEDVFAKCDYTFNKEYDFCKKCNYKNHDVGKLPKCSDCLTLTDSSSICYSKENYLDAIKEFRKHNWYDCHALSKIKKEIEESPEKSSETDETKFYFDDRLFLMPVVCNGKSLKRCCLKCFPLHADIPILKYCCKHSKKELSLPFIANSFPSVDFDSKKEISNTHRNFDSVVESGDSDLSLEYDSKLKVLYQLRGSSCKSISSSSSRNANCFNSLALRRA